MSADQFTSARYARIVLRGEAGKRQTRYVKIAQDGALSSGLRVTADGDTHERRVPGGVAHEQIVWTPADVITRTEMRMSLHYGRLVEVAA